MKHEGFETSLSHSLLKVVIPVSHSEECWIMLHSIVHLMWSGVNCWNDYVDGLSYKKEFCK
jgi:hypothetical protein